MQKETGCKIAVRGQGACLDKPGRLVHPDDNEPLHVHITAPNQEAMDKATKMINDLLEEVKTGGGEHKAKQLRELATINGTLRIESRCRICGGQHPIYRCPEKTGEKWTPADVQCKICGELTHVTEDCKHKRGKHYSGLYANNSRPSIDAEYTAFMQELIGDAPMSSNRPVAAITGPTSSAKPTNNTTNKATDQKENGTKTNGAVNNGNYHNVPPPSQNGAKPPAEYTQNGSKSNGNNNVNGNDGSNVNKGSNNGVNNNNSNGHTQRVGGNIQNGMMPPMYPPPMGMPMMGMAPNPYGMGMPMNPYGMRPGYPMGMPMNPYMRPPMPPFNPYGAPPNPYMQPNPYPPPPQPQPTAIPPPPPPTNPPQ